MIEMIAEHCKCDTMYFTALGPSSVWSGVFPDACWSREEPHPQASPGLCPSSTCPLHAHICRPQSGKYQSLQ